MSSGGKVVLVAPDPAALRVILAPLEVEHVLVALPSIEELLPRASAGGVDLVVLSASVAPGAAAVAKALEGKHVPLVVLADPPVAWLLVEAGATVLPASCPAATLLSVCRALLRDASLRRGEVERGHEQGRMIQALSTQLRGLRDLQDALAHELRTPAGIVRGFATNLRDGIDGPLSPDQQDSVGAIVRAADQLAQLLDRQDQSQPSIQAVARDSPTEAAERRRTVRTEEDLGELVEDVVWQFGDSATQAGLHLEVEVQPKLPKPWLDRSRITQVVSNLLSNAMKYTPRGGRVRVEVSQPGGSGGDALVRKLRGELRVAVCDSGPGVPPEHRDRVWERYHRVPGSLAAGQGIGLAVVREIVLAHGGRVGLESKAGATFQVWLPVDLRGRRLAGGVLVIEDPAVLCDLVQAIRLSSPTLALPSRRATTAEEAADALLRGEAGVVLAPSVTLATLVRWLGHIDGDPGGGGGGL